MESFKRFLRVIAIIMLVVGIACAKRNPQAKMPGVIAGTWITFLSACRFVRIIQRLKV